MSISDTLSEAALEIEKYLASGHYGSSTDTYLRVIEHLLAHMKAVRWLPGFDHIPDDELLRKRLAAIAKSFGTSSEDARKAYHPGALDVNQPENHDINRDQRAARREDLDDEVVEPCIVCGEPADMRVGYEGDRCMGCDGAVCDCECLHVHNDEGCEGEQNVEGPALDL